MARRILTAVDNGIQTPYTGSSARKTLFVIWRHNGTTFSSNDAPLFSKKLPQGVETMTIVTDSASQIGYVHETTAGSQIRGIMSSGITNKAAWNRIALKLDKADVFISGTNISNFCNGVKVGSNISWAGFTPNNHSPNAIGTNPWTIGRGGNRFNANIAYLPGDVAEACYWDEMLPDDVLIALTAGTITPLEATAYLSNIRFYGTFNASAPTQIQDLKDWTTGTDMLSPVSLSIADHPTIAYPATIPTPPPPVVLPDNTIYVQINGNSVSDAFKITGIIELGSMLTPKSTFAYSRQNIPGSPLSLQYQNCQDADPNNDGFVEQWGNTKQMIQGTILPPFPITHWNFQPFDRRINDGTIASPTGDLQTIIAMLNWGRPPQIATNRVENVQGYIYQRWRRTDQGSGVDLSPQRFKNEYTTPYVEQIGNFDYERQNFFTQLVDALRASPDVQLTKPFLMVPVGNIWLRFNEEILLGNPIFTGQYAFPSAWYLLRNPQGDNSGGVANDGIHASNIGSYIAGLAHLMCWSQTDVRTIPYNIPNAYTSSLANSPNDRPITQEMDTFLKRIVSEEVKAIPEYTGWNDSGGGDYDPWTATQAHDPANGILIHHEHPVGWYLPPYAERDWKQYRIYKPEEEPVGKYIR